jgi:putative nucleotidyltransferase with HDIG domain
MEDAVQQTEGCTAHSQRVAAYCYEVAASLGLTARQQAVLRHAALEHHKGRISNRSASRIIADLGISASLSHQTPRQTLKDKVLDVFHGVAEVAEPEVATLSSILEMADHFDEELEFGQYSELGTAALLDSELSDTLENPAVALILPGLRASSMAQIWRLAPKLPVFPKVALQVIQCLKSGDVALETLEELSSSDPVIAGTLVKVSRSALYARSFPARNTAEAVACLGTEIAGKVLLEIVLKPLLHVPGAERLWRHALEAAYTAEAIAKKAGLNEKDAYLLGLLHDVGSLLLRLLPHRVVESEHRLIAAGCPRTVAEMVVCGATHAEAGACVLRAWQMPEDYITAVEYHHEPEHTPSVLSSLLYLVESCTDSGEDLPSEVRFRTALNRLGLSADDLRALRIRKPVLDCVG